MSVPSLRGRLGAHTLHATHDSRELTAAAREAFLARFEREVDAADPEGKLDPIERARRIEYARRLYFARLAYRSQVIRAERKAEQVRAKRPWLAGAAVPVQEDDGHGR